MNALFSIKLWLIFLERIINVLYPANILFLIFLYPIRKKIKVTNVIQFILLLVGIDLLIRMTVFFVGVPFSHRYFYPFLMFSMIFAGLGMLSVVSFLHKHSSKKFPRLTQGKITVIIAGIIFLAYTGKALHSSNDKRWLKEISFLIKDNTPQNKQAVILSNYDEYRFVYYSGASEMMLFSPESDFQIMHYVQKNNNAKWKELTKGWESFKKNIDSLGDRVFVIYRVKKKNEIELKKLFPSMHLLGHFNDTRRKWTFFVLQGEKK